MERLEEKKRQEMQIKKQRREEKARKVAEKKAALEIERKKMKMTEVGLTFKKMALLVNMIRLMILPCHTGRYKKSTFCHFLSTRY